jgi:outer membrane lipoprotein-sorting protein
VLLGSLSLAAPAAASCVQGVADTVQAHYDQVRDFSADFEQTTRSALFGSAGAGSGAPSRGHVVFAKPGKMRWTYSEPEPSLVVSDGAILWLYAPKLHEAQRLPVTDGYLTGAALQFLLGDGKLVDSFEISAESCPLKEAEAARAEGRKPLVELELVPKEPSSYEKLGLTANVETGEVTATRVVDLFGNETRIAFESIRINQDPGAEVFQFTPDEGVEVIELEPAKDGTIQ